MKRLVFLLSIFLIIFLISCNKYSNYTRDEKILLKHLRGALVLEKKEKEIMNNLIANLPTKAEEASHTFSETLPGYKDGYYNLYLCKIDSNYSVIIGFIINNNDDNANFEDGISWIKFKDCEDIASIPEECENYRLKYMFAAFEVDIKRNIVSKIEQENKFIYYKNITNVYYQRKGYKLTTPYVLDVSNESNIILLGFNKSNDIINYDYFSDRNIRWSYNVYIDSASNEYVYFDKKVINYTDKVIQESYSNIVKHEFGDYYKLIVDYLIDIPAVTQIRYKTDGLFSICEKEGLRIDTLVKLINGELI